MRRCEHTPNVLAAWAEGRIDPEAELAAHAEGCDACGRALTRMVLAEIPDGGAAPLEDVVSLNAVGLATPEEMVAAEVALARNPEMRELLAEKPAHPADVLAAALPDLMGPRAPKPASKRPSWYIPLVMSGALMAGLALVVIALNEPDRMSDFRPGEPAESAPAAPMEVAGNEGARPAAAAVEEKPAEAAAKPAAKVEAEETAEAEAKAAAIAEPEEKAEEAPAVAAPPSEAEAKATAEAKKPAPRRRRARPAARAEDAPPAVAAAPRRPAARPKPKPKPSKGKAEVDDLLGALEGGGSKPAGGSAPAAAAPNPTRPEKLSRAQIVNVVRQGAAKASACGEEHGAQGTVMVALTIARSGRVASAQAGGKWAGTPAGDCVEATAKALRFPQFSGDPMRLKMPFAL